MYNFNNNKAFSKIVMVTQIAVEHNCEKNYKMLPTNSRQLYPVPK